MINNILCLTLMDTIYFKLTNRNDAGHYQYHQGLNIAPEGFSDYSNYDGFQNGFYFTTVENVIDFCRQICSQYLWTVRLPLDDPEFRMVGNYIANRIILLEKYPLDQFSTYDRFGIPYPELTSCAMNGFIDLVKYCVMNSASEYEIDYALVLAAENGHTEIVKYLLQNGADASGCNYIIPGIAEQGNLELVKILVENGVDLSITGARALFWSVIEGNYALVKYLVENGVINNEDDLLGACANNNQLDILKFLLENGADLGKDGGAALTTAARYGRHAMVKYLVENGAKPYEPAFVAACREGWLDIVKYFFGIGVDPSFDDDSALIFACRYGYLDMVKFLVENGANIHAMNEDPILTAAKHGHLDVVKYLVEMGANYRTGALSLACEGNHIDVVKYLVETGASVDETYALPRACENGNLDLVKYLLYHGANPNVLTDEMKDKLEKIE